MIDPCDPGYAEWDYQVPENDAAPRHPARSLEQSHEKEPDARQVAAILDTAGVGESGLATEGQAIRTD